MSSLDEEVPEHLRFDNLDRLILPSFLDLINNKEIILDFSNDNSINVSYSKKAMKWIKDVKKKNKHWDEEDFIGKIIYYSAKAAESMEADQEDMKILEAQIIDKENTETENVYNPDEKPD